MVGRAGKAVFISITTAGLLCGCMVTEENPLNVNAERGVEAGADAAPVSVTDFGDDPLNLGENGASLCSVQLSAGYQEYTVLVHNETLETFTLQDVGLGSPENLNILSAEVTPANREGHNHGGGEGDAAGGHAGHGDAVVPAETEEAEEEQSTFLVEPVPAEGYEITTHEYINVVVTVALDEGAESGSSQHIEIDYSAGDQEFTGEHPLQIEMQRTSCA